MPLTKKDLVEAVSSQNQITKTQATELVEEVFETMKSALEKGEQVKISGFGSFNPRDKKARQGRNPKTGETIEIAARRVVTFKASDKLKDRLNDE